MCTITEVSFTFICFLSTSYSLKFNTKCFYSPIGSKTSLSNGVDSENNFLQFSGNATADSGFSYTFTVDGLSNGTVYNFTVECVLGDGLASNSEKGSVETLANNSVSESDETERSSSFVQLKGGYSIAIIPCGVLSFFLLV